MTEIATYQPNAELSEQMEYARIVSSGSMLPASYRGKPADILIAVGLGKAMGLSPAESLYRIHVIQGRPTASAELIAANVRKAGHRLRVQGNDTEARATIVRSDDPEFEFESVWTLDRAKRLDLATKDGWKKQPGTMMRWRAITEVARLACPEALYGVAYVAEEVEDAPERAAAPVVSLSNFAPAPASEPETVDAEVMDDGPDPITAPQLKALHAGLTDLGLSKAESKPLVLAFYRNVIGREVASSKDLTKAEASAVIDEIQREIASKAQGEVPGDLFDAEDQQ